MQEKLNFILHFNSYFDLRVVQKSFRSPEVCEVKCRVYDVDYRPAYAVPRLLAKTGLMMADIDVIEIHEAFAVRNHYIMLVIIKQAYTCSIVIFHIYAGYLVAS